MNLSPDWLEGLSTQIDLGSGHKLSKLGETMWDGLRTIQPLYQGEEETGQFEN